MADFIVVDVNPELRRMALLDRAGRYHVAHSGADVPALRAYVRGLEPEQGFGLLVEVRSGQVHRISFEAVDCSQERALELLHEAAPARASVAVAAEASPWRAPRNQDPWDLLASDRRADRTG